MGTLPRKFLFFLSNALVASQIDLWARYFSLKDLQSTFDKVLDNNNSSLAHQMVNFSMRLVCEDDLKDMRIEEIHKLCNKDHIAITVLRFMTIRYFHLRPEERLTEDKRKYKDSICNLLNINPNKLLPKSK